MKSKTVILMVVAVVCGLAASYMTSRLLADRNEKVKILVAKRKLGPWTQIKNPDEMFELDERPKSDVPKNAIMRPESIKDHVTVKTIEVGEVVVSDNLMDKKQGSLDVQIPPGKRAVAVRTTQEIASGGFVLPGSHVDILHTIKKGDKDPECRVILQNILVRAVDQQMIKPEDRAGFVPATVTLEVTPEQAVILGKIKDVGSITLSLRPFGDDKVVEPTIVEKEPEPKKEPPKKEPEPVVVKQELPPGLPPEPPVEKSTMLVLNGSQWIRATYVTRNGETQTIFEQSSGDAPASPPTAPPPPPPRPTAPAAPGKAEPKEVGGTPPSLPSGMLPKELENLLPGRLK
jgi:pilus assembly protein CpaB